MQIFFDIVRKRFGPVTSVTELARLHNKPIEEKMNEGKLLRISALAIRPRTFALSVAVECFDGTDAERARPMPRICLWIMPDLSAVPYRMADAADGTDRVFAEWAPEAPRYSLARQERSAFPAFLKTVASWDSQFLKMRRGDAA